MFDIYKLVFLFYFCLCNFVLKLSLLLNEIRSTKIKNKRKPNVYGFLRFWSK